MRECVWPPRPIRPGWAVRGWPVNCLAVVFRPGNRCSCVRLLLRMNWTMRRSSKPFRNFKRSGWLRFPETLRQSSVHQTPMRFKKLMKCEPRLKKSPGEPPRPYSRATRRNCGTNWQPCAQQLLTATSTPALNMTSSSTETFFRRRKTTCCFAYGKRFHSNCESAPRSEKFRRLFPKLSNRTNQLSMLSKTVAREKLGCCCEIMWKGFCNISHQANQNYDSTKGPGGMRRSSTVMQPILCGRTAADWLPRVCEGLRNWCMQRSKRN